MRFTWVTLHRVGTLATMVGLCYALYDHHVLAEKIAALEAEKPLARAGSPVSGTSLPAREPTTISGFFSSNVPQDKVLRAALSNGDRYYISRASIQPDNNGGWQLTIRPWDGTWRLFFLMAGSEAAKELDRWRDEKAPDGQYDWNNGRMDLPPGVIRHLVAEYPTYNRK